jgi:hypothetical protein
MMDESIIMEVSEGKEQFMEFTNVPEFTYNVNYSLDSLNANENAIEETKVLLQPKEGFIVKAKYNIKLNVARGIQEWVI